MTRTSGMVTADYGQIELVPGGGGHPVGLGETPSLAWTADGEVAVLTVARQYGDVPVEVHVLDQEPEVDPGWDSAVELSVRTGVGMGVTGWAGTGGPVPVDVAAGADVRVRFAVVDGQRGSDQFDAGDEGPACERYVLQVWQAPPAPPRVVVATSPWSQYWAFAEAAQALVASLADVPDPERFAVLVERALAAHPEVRDRLRAGDVRYQLGVLTYVQELFRVTHDRDVYADLKQDHETVTRLILEAAAAG